MNTYIHQGCIKLIKSGNKDIYNIKKNGVAPSSLSRRRMDPCVSVSTSASLMTSQGSTPTRCLEIDDLLERIGQARYITTLDLCKGYWQVPLDPDSKPYTAFRTPLGLFQFMVLPFGLHGAPATFQRLKPSFIFFLSFPGPKTSRSRSARVYCITCIQKKYIFISNKCCSFELLFTEYSEK